MHTAVAASAVETAAALVAGCLERALTRRALVHVGGGGAWATAIGWQWLSGWWERRLKVVTVARCMKRAGVRPLLQVLVTGAGPRHRVKSRLVAVLAVSRSDLTRFTIGQ